MVSSSRLNETGMESVAAHVKLRISCTKATPYEIPLSLTPPFSSSSQAADVTSNMKAKLYAAEGADAQGNAPN